jgi:hypothetical protein
MWVVALVLMLCVAFIFPMCMWLLQTFHLYQQTFLLWSCSSMLIWSWTCVSDCSTDTSVSVDSDAFVYAYSGFNFTCIAKETNRSKTIRWFKHQKSDNELLVTLLYMYIQRTYIVTDRIKR